MRHKLPDGVDIQVEHVLYVTPVRSGPTGASCKVRLVNGEDLLIRGTQPEVEQARLALIQAMGDRD